MTKSFLYKFALILCFVAGFLFMPTGPVKELLTNFFAGVGIASLTIYCLDMYVLVRRLERE
jgi:hypothetical protein